MNMNSSMNGDHLSKDLIFGVLDDELTTAERLEAESHLAVCELCRQQVAALHELSAELESVVQGTPVPAMTGVRRAIEERIQAETVPAALAQHPNRVMRRFGWGMGIAASLAFVVLMASRHDFTAQPETGDAAQVSTAAQTGTIEVDGETFLPVPYSNADLSTAAPHIVQMQVPVSSLADIGIVFEPVANRIGTGAESERSVLADVLVGADGQPRGVHVIGLE